MKLHVTREDLNRFMELVDSGDKFIIQRNEEWDVSIATFTKSKEVFVLGSVILALMDALKQAESNPR